MLEGGVCVLDDREQDVGDPEAIRGESIGKLGIIFRTATTTGEGCR